MRPGATQRTRTVNVRDQLRPEVTILGNLTQTVQCNDPAYQDPGATASDQCAGTLPATAVPTPNPGAVGTQTISYRATDPAGNVGTSSNSRTLTVIDTLAPVVTLNGSAAVPLECANPWTDPGATARDQCAGNLAVTISPAIDHERKERKCMARLLESPPYSSARSRKPFDRPMEDRWGG